MNPQRRVELAALALAAAIGCAEAPVRDRGATVAPDRNQIPRGETIPATGLGVDLVNLAFGVGRGA
jgi:hypothetical protein